MANFDDLQVEKKKKIDWERVDITNAIFDSFESGMFAIVLIAGLITGLIILMLTYPKSGFIVAGILLLLWAIVAIRRFMKNVKSQNKYKYDQ